MVIFNNNEVINHLLKMNQYHRVSGQFFPQHPKSGKEPAGLGILIMLETDVAP